MKVKVDREELVEGKPYIPQTSQNDGKSWGGGTPMSLSDLEEYGNFLIHYARNMRALGEEE